MMEGLGWGIVIMKLGGLVVQVLELVLMLLRVIFVFKLISASFINQFHQLTSQNSSHSFHSLLLNLQSQSTPHSIS